MIIDCYSDVDNKDVLAIGVTDAFDIGIAKEHRSARFYQTPAKCQEILKKQLEREYRRI
jgi:hypothetical protein